MAASAQSMTPVPARPGIDEDVLDAEVVVGESEHGVGIAWDARA
jgi:hypothetical protein